MVTGTTSQENIHLGEAARSYVIVGGGAIGGTIGYSLTRAGIPVAIVDKDRDHVSAINSQGLRIRSADGDGLPERMRAYHPDDYPRDLALIEYAIIATKSQDTRAAARWLSPFLAPDGYVVSLQNGNNELVIAEETGDEGRVISAFVNIFSDYLEPGVISFGGRGTVAVGIPGGGAPNRQVLDVVQDLQSYGSVVSTWNIGGYRFAKRGFSGILEMTTLVDAPMSETVDRHRRLAGAIAGESTEVAVRAGIPLQRFDGYDPYPFCRSASQDARDGALDRLVAYLAGQPKTRSGIFRDIAVRRRPIEHDPDDGYRCLAQEHGVELTFETILQKMLEDLSIGKREFGPSNLHELESLL